MTDNSDYKLLISPPEWEYNGKKRTKEEDIDIEGLVPTVLKEFKQEGGRIIKIPFNKDNRPLVVKRNNRLYPDESRKDEIFKYKTFIEYEESGKIVYHPHNPLEKH